VALITGCSDRERIRSTAAAMTCSTEPGRAPSRSNSIAGDARAKIRQHRARHFHDHAAVHAIRKRRQPRLQQQFVHRRNLPQQFRLLVRNRAFGPGSIRTFSTERSRGQCRRPATWRMRVPARPPVDAIRLCSSMEVRGFLHAWRPLTKSWPARTGHPPAQDRIRPIFRRRPEASAHGNRMAH